VSTREVRIQRVLRLRDERLKRALQALEEARAAERKASAEHGSAVLEKQQAEAARRAQNLAGAGILDFIEAEEWLRSRCLTEELQRQRLRLANLQFEKSQARVKEERTKLRQLEQLQERMKQARRAKENRLERAAEDEIGQRIAQTRRNQR
jgi:flagellar biosynthesis chaperone FliJ